jgi:hypothetical protein
MNHVWRNAPAASKGERSEAATVPPANDDTSGWGTNSRAMYAVGVRSGADISDAADTRPVVLLDELFLLGEDPRKRPRR